MLIGMIGIEPRSLRFPLRVALKAPLAHAEALVCTVKVAVTTLVPETVVLGNEKQPFEREGLLDTENEMVPV